MISVMNGYAYHKIDTFCGESETKEVNEEYTKASISNEKIKPLGFELC